MSVKKGALRHIRIEPDTAKGSKGAQVAISKHMSESAQKGGWLRNEDEEKKSHKTPEEAAAHVLQTLKEHFGAGANEDDGIDGAKASKGGKSANARASHPASDNGPAPTSDSW
jgi:hypothetical protein